jgi:hypothetical protein
MAPLGKPRRGKPSIRSSATNGKPGSQGSIHDGRPGSTKNAQTYRETGSIRETAQSWHTTREVVRRYPAEGEARPERSIAPVARNRLEDGQRPPRLRAIQAHGFPSCAAVAAGRSGAEPVALFPPLVLDPTADALLVACNPEVGDYMRPLLRQMGSARIGATRNVSWRSSHEAVRNQEPFRQRWRH